MSPQVLSLVILVIMFVIATVLPINMGALGFVAAFLFGTLVLDLKVDAILENFPAGLFLTVAGITYLFGSAQINGTVDLLIRGAVRAVGGRVAAIRGSCSPSPRCSSATWAGWPRPLRRRSRSSAS